MNNERPWSITAACAVSVAIFVWDLATGAFDEEILAQPGWLALHLALSTLPMLFTIAAFLRRNWGRIGLAVMSTLGVLAVPIFMYLGEPLIDAQTALYSIAEVLIVVFLFMPAANAWYRSRFAAAAGST